MKKATWEDVYSENELTKAVLHFAKKCLYIRYKALNASWDEETAFHFMKDSDRRQEAVHKMLCGPVEEIEFRPYLRKDTHIKSKTRSLYIATWDDRIIDALLNRLLVKATRGWLSNNSYAFRNKQNSLHACQRKIRKALETHRYIIKRDISSFYNSIPHGEMIDVLSDITEGKLFELLKKKVKFQYTYEDGGEVHDAEIGLSFGSSLAPMLSNIFLTPLDKKLEEVEDVMAFRYADDILILSSIPEQASKAARLFDTEIEKLKLTLKDRATMNVSFEDHPDFEKVKSFMHLGLEFHSNGDILLSSSKIHKIMNIFRFAFRRRKKKLENIKDLDDRLGFLINLANNELDRVRPMAIIDYYLRHTSSEDQFKKIDQWLAEEIIAKALKKGHKKGNFRKVPFKKLRDMGLMSLVHRRRLIHHGHIDNNFDRMRQNYLAKRSQHRPVQSP